MRSGSNKAKGEEDGQVEQSRFPHIVGEEFAGGLNGGEENGKVSRSL